MATPQYPPLAVVKQDPLNVESTPVALTQPITANEQFYVRTNFGVPQLPTSSYTLRLRGLAGVEHGATIEDLRALGTIEVPVTLECAGNHRSSSVPLPPGETWRGGAVGTAVWTGVPLRRLVESFDLLQTGTGLLFTGADAGTVADERHAVFQRALEADLARTDGPLLAFEMNGEPLPREHGAPLRLVMPGWYAMASVKWLVSIEAVDRAFAGYFQSERYVYRTANADTPVQAMRVKSFIATPAADALVEPGPVKVTGWAWSGSAPIAAVHVATRGGGDWEAARLGPEMGRWAWRSWEFDWEPEAAGHHLLRCRATDASGATQPDVAEWNALGYGNNAIQPHSVFVR